MNRSKISIDKENIKEVLGRFVTCIDAVLEYKAEHNQQFMDYGFSKEQIIIIAKFLYKEVYKTTQVPGTTI